MIRPILLSACLVAGCSRPAPPAPGITLAPNALIRIEGPSGSYLILSANGSAGGTSDNVKFEYKDGRLTVDGKRYGAVKAGDHVKLDKAGTVTVNGQPREPIDSPESKEK